MAVWAYTCRLCDEHQQSRYVSQTAIDAMPSNVRIVRVKVGSQWRCAVVDRTRRSQVEGLLVREVIASDEVDCQECAKLASVRPPADAGQNTAVQGADVPRTSSSPQSAKQPDKAKHDAKLLAAAISPQDDNLIVVLVTIGLLRSPGEAELVITDLQARFGTVAVVLVAQDEDGLPAYHGKADLVQRLAGLPLDDLPWKEYSIA